jgi:hypothetical protein
MCSALPRLPSVEPHSPYLLLGLYSVTFAPRKAAATDVFQLELSYYLSDWQILATYPLTNLTEEDGKTRVRWFLAVNADGIVTDLMTGTQSSGLYMDILCVPSSLVERHCGK